MITNNTKQRARKANAEKLSSDIAIVRKEVESALATDPSAVKYRQFARQVFGQTIPYFVQMRPVTASPTYCTLEHTSFKKKDMRHVRWQSWIRESDTGAVRIHTESLGVLLRVCWAELIWAVSLLHHYERLRSLGIEHSVPSVRWAMYFALQWLTTRDTVATNEIVTLHDAWCKPKPRDIQDFLKKAP